MMYYSKDLFLKYYHEYGLRLDGRKWDEYRKIAIKKDIISTAEGSAIAKIGKTIVIAGIKVEIGELFEQNKANLIVNVDLSPIAHESFISGPPDERSIEISRVVDRGFRSAEVLDLEALVLEPNKGYTLFLDMYILDYDGNAIDTCYLAGMGALLNLKIPVYENNILDRSKYLDKSFLKNTVYSNTFVKIGDELILDPNYMESELADASISIVLDRDRNLVSIQKSGNGQLTRDDINKAIDISINNIDKIDRLLIG